VAATPTSTRYPGDALLFRSWVRENPVLPNSSGFSRSQLRVPVRWTLVRTHVALNLALKNNFQMTKKALVTGAGRGIGKGCALALARKGIDLVINDRPASPDVQGTAEEIRALGPSCEVIEADVFERTECERLVAEAIERMGGLDILISNPAFGVRNSFLEYDPDDFDKVIRGALTSGFLVSQLVARHLVQQGNGGKIVFISSVQGELPIANSVAYNAAKAGLNHMGQTIAVELCQHRINVNVIEPGWIETPGEHKSFGAERIAAEGPKLPWGRIGTPDDIGNAAAFLASDEADYISGSILKVDGLFSFQNWIRGEA